LGKLTTLKLGNNKELSGDIPKSLCDINYKIDGTKIKTKKCL